MLKEDDGTVFMQALFEGIINTDPWLWYDGCLPWWGLW